MLPLDSQLYIYSYLRLHPFFWLDSWRGSSQALDGMRRFSLLLAGWSRNSYWQSSGWRTRVWEWICSGGATSMVWWLWLGQSCECRGPASADWGQGLPKSNWISQVSWFLMNTCSTKCLHERYYLLSLFVYIFIVGHVPILILISNSLWRLRRRISTHLRTRGPHSMTVEEGGAWIETTLTSSMTIITGARGSLVSHFLISTEASRGYDCYPDVTLFAKRKKTTNGHI